MRINSVKLFDDNQIPEDIRPKIGPLVTWLNSAVDQIITALQGQLTLGDNIKGSIITVSAKHNTAKIVSVDTTADVVGVLPLKADEPVSGFGWSKKDDKYLNLTISFTSSPTTAQDVRILLLRA